MADTAVDTAPGDENDDSWLYGESGGDQIADKDENINEKQLQASDAADGAAEEDDKEAEENEENDDFNDEHFADVGKDDGEQANGDADSQDNGDSDSDDSDDVKVTIGEIKSGPQAYGSLNIKRGVGLVATGAPDKPRGGTATGNKVTLEDLEGPGSINGVPAMEFNIDTIEDKPWNKPGADISDYFNYGFNEVTWSAYCERQRRLRMHETGVGLHVVVQPRPPAPDIRRPTGTPVRMDENMQTPMGNNYQARENTIQVMTAERRDYGRVGHGPPDYFAPPPDHYYPPHQHPHAPYENHWGHPEQSGWVPTDIKELTPGPMGPPPMGPPVGAPNVGAPPAHVAPPPLMAVPSFTAPFRQTPPHPHDRERDRDRERERARERDDRDRHRRDEDERERERDRGRSRSIKPDRVREKSYRRERSRSRSRRHKSRSRSPRPRERDRDRDRSRERERERSLKPKKDKEKDEEK